MLFQVLMGLCILQNHGSLTGYNGEEVFNIFAYCVTSASLKIYNPHDFISGDQRQT